MLKNIIQTIFSKGIISIINFLIVIITAKYTGAAGRGEISMMYLNITVVLLLNDFIGGGALVFLTPRHHFNKLFSYAFTWAVCCGIFLPLLFNLYLKLNSANLSWFITLSVLLNLSSCCNSLLNGKNKIKENNIGNLIQSISLILLLVIFIFSFHNNTPSAYYAALLIGYALNLLISIYFLRKEFFDDSNKKAENTWQELFFYGAQLQWGNIVQLLNYRLSYYLLTNFFVDSGKKMVGIYSTATSVSEAAWLIMNGISMVQYAKISNSQDKNYAIDVSAKLAKLSFIITLAVVVILNILPLQFFVWLFGIEFIEIKQIIILLSPGIAFLGLTGIYAHYFAGLGLMKISSMSAMVGFIVTLASGFLLIPLYNIHGAAVSASLSYFASGLFLIVYFKKHSQISFKKMFFDFRDILKLN